MSAAARPRRSTARDALPAILDVGLLGIADEVVAHRLVLVAADELVDITVEGGGEEHRLALLRHHVEQLHDLGQEAEIGHAIGLVDHGDLDAVERHGTPFDEIEQPTRAGDDQRRTAAQRRQLGAVGHPAVDGEDVAPARLAELDELGADLLRQLAGGDEDDARGVVGFGAADAGEHRDAEGEGLAGAGGSAPAEVAPGEGVGQAGGLHGERFGDPGRVERVDELRRHAERAKRGRHF